MVFFVEWLPGAYTHDEDAFTLNPDSSKSSIPDSTFCIIDEFGFTVENKGRWGGTRYIPDFGRGVA